MGPIPGGDRRVLVFGSYDAALHPRVAVLRDGLAARGWQVRELNEPLGAATADKVAAAGSPAAALRLAARQLRSWTRLALRSRGAGQPAVVLVGYLGHADVHLARLRYRRSVIVLDHLVGLSDTMRDRSLGGGVLLWLLDLVDRAALRAADVVVVDTEQQAQLLPLPVRPRAVVVPVGAGAQWFEAGIGATGHDPGILRVVFVGLFTPLQGAPTIGRAIDLLRDEPIEFTMVGHGQDYAEARASTRGSARVRWLDWVAADDLPALVAAHDVSLGIFGTGPKAQRVVPTKVYQGLAAGCAVVTAATPAAGTLGDAVVPVPPGDPEALAAALRHLAADKESLTVARTRARAVSTKYSPGASVRALDEWLVGVTRQQPRRLPPLTFNAHLRWDVITRELEGLDAVDVLEIGPGEGAVAARLAPGRSYTGVELSERTRAITERRLAQLGSPARLVASLADLPAAERFDLVCAFEVIEHIDDDREALAAWAARLRPGGTLLISTPSGPHRMGAADEIAGHFRRYSAEGLAALAGECGLSDVRVTHVGYPVGYALEWVRNTVAARRLRGGARDAGPAGDAAQHQMAVATDAPDAVAAATEQSSSFLQPPPWSGRLTHVASVPGIWLQRRRPGAGTGLVLVARAAR